MYLFYVSVNYIFLQWHATFMSCLVELRLASALVPSHALERSKKNYIASDHPNLKSWPWHASTCRDHLLDLSCSLYKATLLVKTNNIYHNFDIRKEISEILEESSSTPLPDHLGDCIINCMHLVACVEFKQRLRYA